MNFMPKLSKKPSKQNIRPKKREKNRNNEEEYIEVDLEIEEEERPPIPMFIGGPESNNPAIGGDFDDEFFDGAVEDDLSLGEEANIFYDKQRNNSFRQNSSNNLWQPNGAGGTLGAPGSNYLAPSPQITGEIPIYGIAGPNVDSQNLNHSYPPNNYLVPPPIRIPSGYQVNQMPLDNQQIPQSPAIGGMYYPGRPGISTPHYGQTGYMHPPPTPMTANNYLGLSDLEMIEFHQLVANGVPEMDAIQSIQYSRISVPAAIISTPISRKPSGIPPVSAVEEEDEVYQRILKESIEEERRRQERMRNVNDEELTQDEAMKIAIQESYDDYERRMRGGSNRHMQQSFGSPSFSNSGYSGPSTGRSAPKSSGKPPKIANSIEKANEDALRQAILLSMQESNSNSAEKRTQSINSQYSHPAPPPSYQSSIPQTPKGMEPLDTRVFSVATRSGSSDPYNDYADYGLVPDHLPHSPYPGLADASSMSRQSIQNHNEFFAPRAPPPSSSSKVSGNYSPAHFPGSPASATGLHLGASRDSHAAHPSGNAAQMILSRRNQSFSAGDSLRSRSSDSQDPRVRRMNQSMSDIIPDSQYY